MPTIRKLQTLKFILHQKLQLVYSHYLEMVRFRAKSKKETELITPLLAGPICQVISCIYCLVVFLINVYLIFMEDKGRKIG